jgi:hypothetical protein
MAGMITALVVLGVVDLCVIADARAKRKRKIEDDLHRQVEEARAQRATEQRRERWARGDVANPGRN